MSLDSLEALDQALAQRFVEILQGETARELIGAIASGDRRPYALWLCQVAHLTRHTAAHQPLVGPRVARA